MSIKKIGKKILVSLAESSMGPKIQEFLRGSSEIVNMYAGREFRMDMTKKLTITDLIKDNKQSIDTYKKYNYLEENKKIKIRFFHCSATTFNVIKTVCESFNKDPKFDVLIVLFGSSYTGMISQMNEEGYNYIADYDYDLDLDSPDISVIYHLEISYPPQLQRIREKSKFLALIPLSIGSIWFGDRTVSRMHLDQFQADMCFVGNLCYERLVDDVGLNVIESMSPPQFDLAYQKMNKPIEYPKGWEKLKNKKTVMLMTDHGLKMDLVSDEVTFDLYIQTIMSYINKNSDMGLILRMHYALVQELLSTYWKIEDYQRFRKFCDESENVVWDDTDDYLIGLSIADASIVDVNCSLIYYVLAAKKPIAVPLRYDMAVHINNPELIEHYYTICSESDCVKFFDMVREEKDPMKESRLEAFDKFINTFDGNNGERIYKKIIEKYKKIHGDSRIRRN